MRRADGRSCAPQRAAKAGSTKPMPDAPLSIIGCTLTLPPLGVRTLPCTFSSADGSVRVPCRRSGGGWSVLAAVGVSPGEVVAPPSCCEQLQPRGDAVLLPPLQLVGVL